MSRHHSFSQFIRWTVVALLPLLVVVQPADAQPGCEIERLGGLGGRAVDMAVDGTWAFVANEPGGLLTIDISDPSEPTMAAITLISDSLSAVEVSDSVVYVADWNKDDGTCRFEVYDSTDPTHPALLGSVEFRGYLSSMTEAGGFVFATNTVEMELTIIDVNDPAQPTVVGTVATADDGRDVTVHDGRAYVASNVAGLEIFDISVPSNPHYLGGINTPDNANGVAIEGTLAYVADGSTGLMIIDVTDPAAPEVIGSVPGRWEAQSVAVADGYAYFADARLSNIITRLQVVDVGDPSDPRIVGSVTADDTICQKITLRDTTLYAAAGGRGTVLFDVENPSSPSVLGSISTPDDARGLAIREDTVCIANLRGAQNFYIMDVSDPALPVVRSTLFTPGVPHDVAMADGLAIIADGYEGLQFIDMRNPDNPSIFANLALQGEVNHVEIVGTFAYVSDSSDGLIIVDFSLPTKPLVVGSLEIPGRIGGIAVLGDYAYVADGSNGLHIIDITTPSDPMILSTLPTADHALDVAVSPGIAFVADDDSGLQVVDVQDPRNPQIISTLRGNGANHVTVQGSRAYVASTYTVLVVDVSDPTNPIALGSGEMPTHTGGVIESDGLIFVTAASSGLHIFDPTPCDQCLELVVQDLIAGQRATFTITRGTPGSRAVTVFGLHPGMTTVSNLAGYCATFGIKGIKKSRIIGGLNRVLDANGESSFGLNIPSDLVGVKVLFQSAERDTCPDECMSNLVEMVVQ